MFIGENDDGSITEMKTRDVNFLKKDFLNKREVRKKINLYEIENLDIGAPSSSNENVEEIHQSLGDSGSDLPTSSSVPIGEDLQVELHKSKRESILHLRFEIKGEAFMIALQDKAEPKSLKEALSSLVAKEWNNVMNEEMESIRINQVWDLVDLPLRRKTIGNKWVLKVKRKVDGFIERYKVCLVTKGYTQQEGVDYEETFSSIVRFVSIHLILAIVANLEFELYQMDVKTSFLNGKLDEEIYMDQPQGFVTKGQ